ncbi:hypothetical protein MO387_16795 [Shewanella sp. N2AIL]|uniref:hypothetical protein n=1 Tax=Shewanella sp. N2AIL TaxID=2926851 RepID=UPI001F5AD2A9|nr:hypothetical protein [Shewanella sp. N2AIL]MCI2964734.1 hypothetical protein [Shewanella sp. N2AIL]
MKKIKKSTESMQLSSIIHAPIFATSNYNVEEKSRKLVSYEVSRTKYERIIYNGLELNASDDFPLFAIIVSKYQQSKKFSITLTDKELFEALKLSKASRTEAKRKVLVKRIKRLEFCHVELFYYKSGCDDVDKYSTRLSFPLFESTFYDTDTKEIKIELSRKLGVIATAEFSEELIDLTVYYKIKTQYAKAVYLFLQTKKFKNQSCFYVDLHKFLERFGHSNMETREKKRKLKIALDQLVSLNHISGFEFEKIDDIDKVKIINKMKKEKEKEKGKKKKVNDKAVHVDEMNSDDIARLEKLEEV